MALRGPGPHGLPAGGGTGLACSAGVGVLRIDTLVWFSGCREDGGLAEVPGAGLAFITFFGLKRTVPGSWTHLR